MRLPAEWHDWRPAPGGIRADAEIGRLRAAGYGTTAIARSLNSRGIPTPSGRGQWWPDTVRRHADPIARARWAHYVAGYRQGLRRRPPRPSAQ
jgi:hypothetical protein